MIVQRATSRCFAVKLIADRRRALNGAGQSTRAGR